VQEQFAEKFPETPVPHRNAFRRLTEKFRETGSVLDTERFGRPSERNDKTLMYISDYAAGSVKIIAQVGARERYRTSNST
jgi:hypothetical protein